MDKKLFERAKAAMPTFMMDEQGNRITHAEYMAGATDPYPYDDMDTPFSFLGSVRKDAEKTTYKRRGVSFRGDGFAIPPFDPFHDHLTSLIVKDRRVQRKVSMLFGLEGLRKYPEWIAGVTVHTDLLGSGEIIVTDCPAFKRNIPGLMKPW